MPRLSKRFFQLNEVVEVARALIGKVFVTKIDGLITSGLITETEAYHQSEKACHAYNGRRTNRTEVLFGPGGKSYVYLCYGIHHLFNVTTGVEGEAAAVLVRAIEPLDGVDYMLERRRMTALQTRVSSGPGKLTQALGVTVKNNNTCLITAEDLWIETYKEIPQSRIVASKRIGVNYAREDSLLPWRFYLKNSKWVSSS